MACRISEARFLAIAEEEAASLGLASIGLIVHDPLDPFNMAEVEDENRKPRTAFLNRKAIQSLVDEPEQARPIIRNLLRWAKEHGAR